MLKRICLLGVLFSSFLQGSLKEIPSFIDFGSDEFRTHFYDQEFRQDLVTTCPFNCALEMSTFFMYIKNEYRIQTLIETGTFKANTTTFFGSIFDVVHTIEVSPEFYADAEVSLRRFQNVQCHLGSSPEVLQQILPSIAAERVIFYLDAHWYVNWPLLDELAVINKTHQDNCIVIIDDFKVPGRMDIPYDTHCDGNEYSFEYIKSSIDQIFKSGYTVHYLIPRDVQSRGKIVVIPKKWISN